MIGTSSITSIPIIVAAIDSISPKSVIDIGAGQGVYGMLCRAYVNPERIDYLEPEMSYYNDVISEIYDEKYFVKIQGFKFDRDYDVALLIAVMCRFTKEEGLEVLKNIKEHCKDIIVTIEKEQHGGMTQWKPEDFPEAKVVELLYEYLIIC